MIMPSLSQPQDQTGSGKTYAYDLLPLLQQIYQTDNNEKRATQKTKSTMMTRSVSTLLDSGGGGYNILILPHPLLLLKL
jgi:hypothetical protein